jgi:hypothetical protein
MSIFDVPKSKRRPLKPSKPEKTGKPADKSLAKSSGPSAKNGTEAQEEVDEATAKLMSDMAKAEQDKIDNSYERLRVVEEWNMG